MSILTDLIKRRREKEKQDIVHFAHLCKTSTSVDSDCAETVPNCAVAKVTHSNAQILHKPKASGDAVLQKSTNSTDLLIQHTIRFGYDHGLNLTKKDVEALIPPGDIRDADHCVQAELAAWGLALALRAARERGVVPTGWDKIANCQHCGPVYSFAGGDCVACPWCELKRARKSIPVPTYEESR